jgi:hypothetical protein
MLPVNHERFPFRHFSYNLLTPEIHHGTLRACSSFFVLEVYEKRKEESRTADG